MATRTRLQIAQAIGDSLKLRRSGTATGGTATTLVAANYPYRTALSNANANRFVGDELYVTSSDWTGTPNPNLITTYAPTTGTLTPDTFSGDIPINGDTFDIYSRGVSITQINGAINEALRQMRYPFTTPITLVTDGDMENSGVGDWTATTATLTKVTGTQTLYWGTQSLRVLATAANGRAQSGTLLVDPTTAPGWYVWAVVRADVGTARLIAYDVTNAANIQTQDWTLRGWGMIGFSFQLPATCEALAFRLVSVANGDDCYWDHLGAYPQGGREFILPSWISERTQLLHVWDASRSVNGTMRYDTELWTEHDDYDLVADYSNPNNQWKLRLDPAAFGPIYLQGSRGFSELATDGATTYCDREWIELAGSVVLLDQLQNAPPTEETAAWRAEYQKRLRRLKLMNSLKMPKIVRVKALRAG